MGAQVVVETVEQIVEPLVSLEKSKKIPHEVEIHEFEEASFATSLIAYLNLALLVIFGYIRDFMRLWGYERTLAAKEYGNEGFNPLYHEFESFYQRNVYNRGNALTASPVAGKPGAVIEIIERKWGAHLASFKLTDRKKKYLNVGSYNYLGFAGDPGDCSEAVKDEIRQTGGGVASSRTELGTLKIHRELERLVAMFMRKEEAICFGMGFATNSLNIPALVDKGCLLISDELNHSSLILGARLSGAKIKVFKHNDMKDFEKVIRDSIVSGQPKTHREWRKILVIVEGLYSMEGTFCDLPTIVRLKKKYGFYLYVDEAHSIGALGETGRGITEHYGVDPDDIDILMGTFSKSFGACGGYISGSKAIIAHIRRESHANFYATSMSPAIARQIIAAMTTIMYKPDGKRRINQVLQNTRYFREELTKRGYITYGDSYSPVIPLLIFSLGSLCAFAKESLNRGLASVIVAFPATSMLGARARFCISAAHTKTQLDQVLDILEDLDPIIGLKMSKSRKSSAFVDFWKHFFYKKPTDAKIEF